MEVQAHFSRGGFDFTVDLSAQNKHQAGDIELGQPGAPGLAFETWDSAMSLERERRFNP